MSKKNTYALIAILLLIGICFFEFYLDDKAKNELFQQGVEVKEETNTFFLPTSTTGQIVHHDGYSLSYSEAHEQAEWVAYELKKTFI